MVKHVSSTINAYIFIIVPVMSVFTETNILVNSLF